MDAWTACQASSRALLRCEAFLGVIEIERQAFTGIISACKSHQVSKERRNSVERGVLDLTAGAVRGGLGGRQNGVASDAPPRAGRTGGGLPASG